MNKEYDDNKKSKTEVIEISSDDFNSMLEEAETEGTLMNKLVKGMVIKSEGWPE